jgi:hypothetical protein
MLTFRVNIAFLHLTSITLLFEFESNIVRFYKFSTIKNQMSVTDNLFKGLLGDYLIQNILEHTCLK